MHGMGYGQLEGGQKVKQISAQGASGKRGGKAAGGAGALFVNKW
jgi:hypothetical protein